MIIFPAIDIIDGKPVRLFKGNFATAHQVANDVLETAQGFVNDGAEWVHMVDLDGSLQKKPVNFNSVISVLENTPLKVEIGGGIRTLNDIDFYADKGVKRVILGSVALKDPELVKEAVKEFGELVAVGIDAKNGIVCAEGWTDKSELNYLDLAKQMEHIGVRTIVFTDIDQDGTLAGPNLKQLDELTHNVSCNIIASGGISNLKDIININDLNVYGAITGKAIYTGDLDLSMALQIASKVNM